MIEIKPPNSCHYSMSKDISLMYWELFGIKKGNVLDIGAGKGGLGLAKPAHVSLYGIERDSKIVCECTNYSYIHIGDVEKIVGNEFNGVMFDGVFARDILEHLEKPWVLLDKISAQMVQGGKLICSVPKADPKIVWNDYTHIRGFTKSAIRSLVENSGFYVEKIFPMSGYTLATMLGLARYLPVISRIPILNNCMISWHVIARRL